MPSDNPKKTNYIHKSMIFSDKKFSFSFSLEKQKGLLNYIEEIFINYNGSIKKIRIYRFAVI